MLSIKVDEIKCTGCGTCAAVCSLGHGVQKEKGTVGNLPKARLFVQNEPEKKNDRHMQALRDACLRNSMRSRRIDDRPRGRNC